MFVDSFIKACKIFLMILAGFIVVAGAISLFLAAIFAPFWAAQEVANHGFDTWQPFGIIATIFFLYLYVATLSGLFKDLHI